MRNKIAFKLFCASLGCMMQLAGGENTVIFEDNASMKRAAAIKGEYRFTSGTDFAQWQKAARADLVKKLQISEKLQAPRVDLAPKVLWKRKIKNGTVTKLILQSDKEYSFPVYLCIPDGDGPFPVWICLQGHSTGMHNSIGVAWEDETTPIKPKNDNDFALQCLELGYAALCIEQRAMGEMSGNSNHRTGCVRKGRHALMFGETLLGLRVFDVDRGIDFICTRPELRHDKIGILGNSGGGTATIYSGAILDRITHVMPSSSFCTYRDSIIRSRHCLCNYFPGMLTWGDMGELAGLCAPKPLVIVNGDKDYIFPLKPAKKEFERAKAIYRAAGAPENCQHVIGDGGHRFYKKDAWPVMKKLFR